MRLDWLLIVNTVDHEAIDVIIALVPYMERTLARFGLGNLRAARYNAQRFEWAMSKRQRRIT